MLILQFQVCYFFWTDLLFFSLKFIFYYSGGYPINNHVTQAFKINKSFYQLRIILGVIFWVTTIEFFYSDFMPSPAI